MEFRFARPSVHWVVTTLRTANIKHLRRITVHWAVDAHSVQEVDRQEWQDLDDLLVQLWTSHSIVPKIVYTEVPELLCTAETVQVLLPELVSRGVECEPQ